MNEIKIRNGAFETNSSSTHAIVVDEKFDTSTLKKVGEGERVIEIHGGEFGWESASYDDLETKLDYLYSMCQYDNDFLERVEKLVKIRTGVEIKFDEIDDRRGWSGVYVDHSDSSIFTSMDDETLLKYLFSTESVVLTGNDNDDSCMIITERSKLAEEAGFKVFEKGN